MSFKLLCRKVAWYRVQKWGEYSASASLLRNPLLIHAMSLETEVPEKMQPILRGSCFLSRHLTIDVHPLGKDPLYPFQETGSNGDLGVPFPPGKKLWKRPIPRLRTTQLINLRQRLGPFIGYPQTQEKPSKKCEVLGSE